MNTQPKLGTRKLNRTASKTAARLSVKRIPQATNNAERTAAVQNTIGSILGLAGLSTAKTPSPSPCVRYNRILHQYEHRGTVPHSATCFNSGVAPTGVNVL